MLLNLILSKISRYGSSQISLLKSISSNNSQLYIRKISNAKTGELKIENNNSNQKLVNDVKTLNEVELNLFENSSNKFNPPKGGANAILKKFDIEDKKTEKVRKVLEIPQKVYRKEYNSRIIDDSELNIKYTRLDLNDPLLSKLLMTVKSKKQRDKNHLILLEGRRLILEALECGLHLRTIIFSQIEQLRLVGEKFLEKISEKCSIYKVPQHDLKIWSSLTTPPGVLGIFARPTENEKSLKLIKYAENFPNMPISVICDNIREPNNLGSIIRTAAAVPCEEIIILKGCCDPWESKALRGGCGGQFRIRIKDNINWETFINEIPSNKHLKFLISENNLNKISTLGFENKAEIYSDLSLTFKSNHFIVIIGGEVHGVSENIYNTLSQNNMNATCVHIPLANGVDSLNANTALSLLLFEIRRKYLQDKNSTKQIVQTSDVKNLNY